MITKGIAVYPGLGPSAEDNLKLIEKAAALGCRKLFVSLHIPEADKDRLNKEIQAVLQLATKSHMEVVADIGPETKDLQGITSLRLDDGFSPDAVGTMLAEDGKRKIVLNASTITENFLWDLAKADVDFRRVTALHNFYPHVGTGLSEEFFLSQNALLAKYGVATGAFLASSQGPRGPLFEGLPTLENTRTMSPHLAARYLAALGVQEIIFGDNCPSEPELQAVAGVQDDAIVLTLTGVTTDPALRQFLTGTFITRPEEADGLIRTIESRGRLKGRTIEPTVMQMRPAGTVTIDNKYFGRYQGELSITTRLLPPEFRTTVVGYIPAEELFLVKHLKPGKKFSLISK